MLGRTFDVSKIAKTPFHTLNIDRITKPQKFNLKNISIQHMKQKKIKILCNHGVPFAKILRKNHQYTYVVHGIILGRLVAILPDMGIFSDN